MIKKAGQPFFIHKGHGRFAGGQVMQVTGGGEMEEGEGVLRFPPVYQIDAVILDKADIDVQIVLFVDLIDVGFDALDDIGLLQKGMGQGDGSDPQGVGAPHLGHFLEIAMIAEGVDQAKNRGLIDP